MTTTDPTPLAEQIAREHHRRVRSSGWGSEARCACGNEFTHGTHEEFAAHIATVTERAAQERVAEAIELYADAMWDLIESPNAARLALEEVTRIARGATDD